MLREALKVYNIQLALLHGLLNLTNNAPAPQGPVHASL